MTIAPAEPVVDAHELEHLEFDDPIPCEVKGCPTHDVAEWYGISSCTCPYMALCTDCKGFFEEGRASGVRTVCPACKNIPITFRFVPIAKP